MSCAFNILLAALLLWWLFSKEFPVAIGMLVPTSALRRRWLMGIFVAVVAGAMLLPSVAAMGYEVASGCEEFDVEMLAVVSVATFGTLLLLDRFGMVPSLCVALLGAMEACRVATEGGAMDFGFVLSWIVAPVVAMVLAATIFLFYRNVLGKRNIHLIRLSVVMRYVVIVGIAVLALAIGVNNGSLLIAQSSLQGEGWLWCVALPIVLFVGGQLLFARSFGRLVDVCAERFSDMTTYMVASGVYAVAVTLLLFSSDVVGVVGLRPSPLGVATLFYGALVGVSIFNGGRVLSQREIVRPAMGVVLTPVMAMLLGRTLSSLFVGGEVEKAPSNVAIMIGAAMAIMVVLFGRYVRKQEKLRESSRRLIVSQQQQLFENQKALNALEMKTILAENHSLHSTLELKRKEIINVALGISEQKEFLEMLAEKVHRAAKSSGEEKDRLIAEIEKDLSQRTSFSGEIDEFYTQAEVLHKDFSVKLTEEFPNLTTSERRLATLLRLGFSSKYIATLMNISPKSVEISRYRLRQKLGLQKGDNLISYIKSI